MRNTQPALPLYNQHPRRQVFNQTLTLRKQQLFLLRFLSHLSGRKIAYSMTYVSSISTVRRVTAAQTIILLLVVLCAAVSPAMAMNIYDVVQLSRAGYSDDEIVVMIEATESVFELTSEDIVGLENLGISPQVISTMMKRTGSSDLHDEGPTIEPFKSSFEATDRTATHEAEPADEKYTTRPSSIQSTPTATGFQSGTYPAQTAAVLAPFSITFMREEASGEHQHFTVNLYGARLLVLRDEGRYRSIEDRARAVARGLDEARRLGQGEFRASHVNGEDVVVFRDDTGTLDVSIIVVSSSDAIAYNVRSERRVEADLLAMYWSALLNDYWTIAFQRQPPERLRRLHRGEALMLLYAVVRNIPDDEEFSLIRRVQQLPRSIQSHLERLALAVPDDFDGSHE